ncbi:MAG: helix-turn-helix domain-containing protein [Pseudomonadota bacterium]
MHPALSLEDWRPGFAKRAENFDEVRDRAASWRWEPGVTIWRVEDAIMLGAKDLRPIQRLVLLHYVRRLNQDQLENNIACVWPSSARVAGEIGCSESTLRGHRKALEALGYMVRDYNRANRPADVEAYDLAPLLARLPELEAAADAFDEAFRAERARQAEHLVADRGGISAQAPENRRLEQSHLNVSSSVRVADAPTVRSRSSAQRQAAATGKTSRSSGQTPASAKGGANCSPEGASGFSSAEPQGSVRSEMVRQELAAAFQVSPRLAALVGSRTLADPADASPDDVARIAAAVTDLLPEPERNNDQTFAWALKRHGLRAIAMLAIAIEDPDVRSPCKYFGKMASYDPLGAPDLRLNFARILKAKGQVPPPEVAPAPEPEPPPLMFAPGVEDPRWVALSGELRRIVREGAYGSWFSRVGFHGLVDGVLTISTPTSLAADRIRQDYVPALKIAAEAVDLFVERVVVTVRKR